jgi:isopentenyl phosphate kinase
MLTFLKLGGSLITDKRRRETFRGEVVARLADEIAEAYRAAPEMRLLIGHGSGSFGHHAAKKYGTAEGVHTPEQWRGFAEVGTVAARLDRLVADALHSRRLPVLSLQPSASARCEDGQIVEMATAPVREALARELMPLLYGDVCFDEVRGGTIISTEDILFYLADYLKPDRVLLAGEDEGVYDEDGVVIPRIDPQTLERLAAGGVLGGSAAADVTGGMLSKVRRMLALAERLPGATIRIFSGARPGFVSSALTDPDFDAGTAIVAAP